MAGALHGDSGMALLQCFCPSTTGHPRGRMAAFLALVLLLGLPGFGLSGLGERGPSIDGQQLTGCTLREGERRAFTCRVPLLAPGSMLRWYLDGQQHEANHSAADTTSTLVLTARRFDHQLSCSLTDSASGETLNASVLLNVQYKPEILQADARYQEAEGSGLLLVLSVLVQANPPASIAWVDQDGHVMVNASEFLFLNATRYPANYSLHIHLGSVAGNISVSAANSVGVSTTSLLPAGLLDTHVELPLLGVAIGAALALSAVFGLGSCVAGLVCQQPKPVPDQEPAGRSFSHSSSSEQPQRVHPPRQTQSLPPNLRLSDLAASPRDAGSSAREEESAPLGLENSLTLSKLGFVQLPLSGRIYKVPSVSSEEIWL